MGVSGKSTSGGVPGSESGTVKVVSTEGFLAVSDQSSLSTQSCKRVLTCYTGFVPPCQKKQRRHLWISQTLRDRKAP